VLHGLGLDGILSRIGLGALEGKTDGLALSNIAGKIVLYVACSSP